MSFWTYMLECADGSYYVGHTDDLGVRVARHATGEVEGYTASRLPIHLVWSAEFETRDDAFRCERQLKGWTRAKKAALVRGDWERIRQLAASRSSARGSTGSP